MARRAEKLKTLGDIGTLSIQDKQAIVEFYTTVIASLVAKDREKLKQFLVSGKDHTSILEELVALSDGNLDKKIQQFGFYVVCNGFQNEDPDSFRTKFGSDVLLEFCLKGDSEFFSFGIHRDSGDFGISFARNGLFTDL